MTTTHLHTSWKTSTPLMHSCSNEAVIQLGSLSSDMMFVVVEISDACFVHLLLQDVPHAVVFQLVWSWVVVTSSTAFNSDIWTVVGWYFGLIFLQLSVKTLCVSIHVDHFIHKVKQWHWLGVVDFCCVSLVSHYLNDIPCKNYDYSFVFVKVILKTLLVPFFSGHGVYPSTAGFLREEMLIIICQLSGASALTVLIKLKLQSLYQPVTDSLLSYNHSSRCKFHID